MNDSIIKEKERESERERGGRGRERGRQRVRDRYRERIKERERVSHEMISPCINVETTIIRPYGTCRPFYQDLSPVCLEENKQDVQGSLSQGVCNLLPKEAQLYK